MFQLLRRSSGVISGGLRCELTQSTGKVKDAMPKIAPLVNHRFPSDVSPASRLKMPSLPSLSWNGIGCKFMSTVSMSRHRRALTPTSMFRKHDGTAEHFLSPGPAAQQVRFAGRIGGCKRKKKGDMSRTVHQKGLGKRMEMFWPKDGHRTRTPFYENSRRHVIWDHRLRRWMVMWYRHGIQVFKTFSARGGSIKFEQSRMRAIIFFQQLQNSGKLGRPKPDVCRSGVRGVYFDKDERAWVARVRHQGLRTHTVFSTQELGFEQAFKDAVRTRVQKVRDQHQFYLQRTRWKGKRRHLGTHQT